MTSTKRRAEEISRLAKRYCVTRLRFVECEGFLIWRTIGFNESRSCKVEILDSPNFRVTGYDFDWGLKLNTKGSVFRGEDYISLGIHCSSAELAYISVELSIIDATGRKSNIQTLSYGHCCSQELKRLVSWRYLMRHKEELLPNDELTLSCVVSTTKKIEVSADSLAELSQSNEQHLNSQFFDETCPEDFVLRLGEVQMPAHKMLLASRSPVFAALFENNAQVANELVVTDLDYDVFSELIRFMYSDEVSDFVEKDLAFCLKLLSAASKCDVKPLKARCVDYIRPLVSDDNVFEILMAADACGESLLSQDCMDVVSRELSSVTQLYDWISQLNAFPEVLGIMDRLLKSEQQPIVE